MIGADEVAGSLLAPDGPADPGRARPGGRARHRARRRGRARLGELDVGQAVVVQQGLVLGVEAVEGTDRLLARCGELRREGPGGVLVKLKKPRQERRADLPTIGPATIRGRGRRGPRRASRSTPATA